MGNQPSLSDYLNIIYTHPHAKQWQIQTAEQFMLILNRDDLDNDIKKKNNEHCENFINNCKSQLKI